MDDYMKEMMDLKALVTKTLEKKGVMARIRAELRANIFQAIEEQDQVTESEGGENFALLGQCNERAKQLHTTPAGKLLTGLLCEYLEWCELDRTMHIYLPELNQQKPYSRSELEELLEIKNNKNSASGSAESRPLLLEVLEGYLKYETTLVKESYAVSSSNLPRSSKTSSKPLTNGVDIADEDLNGALESRKSLRGDIPWAALYALNQKEKITILDQSGKVVDQMTSSSYTLVEVCSGGTSLIVDSQHPEASNLRPGRILTPGITKVPMAKPDEPLKDVNKPSGRLSLLGDLPPISGRSGGLAPMVLGNSSWRANGQLSSGGDNSESVDISTTGMHSSHGIGGVGGRFGHSKRESSSQDVDTIQARIVGEKHYGDVLEEVTTKRHWTEIGNNLDGNERDFEFKSADSETLDTLSSTFQQCARDEHEDNSKSCTPASPDLVKSCVTEGDDTSRVRLETGEVCYSQPKDTFQSLPSLDKMTTLSIASELRNKRFSADFYSESDDDAPSLVEEDFNDNSDGQSDRQFYL